MGAWGTGVFEDDEALDWVGGLAEAATLAPVVDALRATEASGYLEAPTCSAALAAAEVVAALNGKAESELRDLWEESREFAAWQATIKNLESRLSDA